MRPAALLMAAWTGVAQAAPASPFEAEPAAAEFAEVFRGTYAYLDRDDVDVEALIDRLVAQGPTPATRVSWQAPSTAA